MMSNRKIINLNIEVSVKKILIPLIFEIDGSCIYVKKSFDKTRYNSSTLDYCIKVRNLMS